MSSKSDKPDPVALKAQLWRAGKLRYKLHNNQKTIYDHYRGWKQESLDAREAGRILPGLYPRIYQLDLSRRYGKDYLCVTLMIEEALRRPSSRFIYGTAHQKDIASICVPLFHDICSDAPMDVKPEYKQAFQGTESGFYFPNGSVILLIGVERNPDSLRGRYADGVCLSEGAFIERLEYALLSVIMPQLQGRKHATIIVNSTPPEAPGTWYDTALTPDCRDNGRYQKRTIDDNPLLSEAEREEFINAAGGRDNDRCKREYFCERLRSDDLVVFPEWSTAEHVKTSPLPSWAVGFSCIDPGVRDLCAVIVGYYDFERAKLVVKRSWAKRGANTLEVATAIRQLEAEVFGADGTQVRFWSGRKIVNNPLHRYSDAEARLILDLSTLHNLKVVAADKQDREAALNALRVAIKSGKIEVDPAAKDLVSHLENAVWNAQRTSYARSPVYGHFDLCDALLYLWRMASPSFRMNPTPPAAHMYTGGHQNMLWKQSDWSHGLGGVVGKLAQILPKRRKSHTG